MGFVLTNGGPLIPPNQRARQHQATETPAGLEEVTMSAELLEPHPFIYAGINLEKIYELNLHSRTFTADGEIWLEWLPNVDKLLKANNTDPAELIHLTNRIETWDSTFEPTTKTQRNCLGGAINSPITFPAVSMTMRLISVVIHSMYFGSQSSLRSNLAGHHRNTRTFAFYRNQPPTD